MCPVPMEKFPWYADRSPEWIRAVLGTPEPEPIPEPEFLEATLFSPPVYLPEDSKDGNNSRTPFMACEFDNYGGWKLSSYTHLYYNVSGALCLNRDPIRVVVNYGNEAQPTTYTYIENLTSGKFYQKGYPQLLHPQNNYPPHKPHFFKNISKDSGFAKDYIHRLLLEEDNTKFCADPTHVRPGRKHTYFDNKCLHNVDSFVRTFSAESGTGLDTLNDANTPAQKYWKKRVNKGNLAVPPWRERECTNKGCDHQISYATNPSQAVMNGVLNKKGVIPDDEVVPITGRNRTWVENDMSSKGNSAVNAWIAYRTYHQCLFKANHHQSEVSGKIKAMYDVIADNDKAKWSDIAKEYTRRRDAFPGASRTWLSDMMATIVSNSGLLQHEVAPDPQVTMPKLIKLPETISSIPVSPSNRIIESQKRARDEEEPEFGRIPKRARYIQEVQKRRLDTLETEIPEQLNTKRIRISKIDSPESSFDEHGYSQRWGPHTIHLATSNEQHSDTYSSFDSIFSSFGNSDNSSNTSFGSIDTTSTSSYNPKSFSSDNVVKGIDTPHSRPKGGTGENPDIGKILDNLDEGFDTNNIAGDSVDKNSAIADIPNDINEFFDTSNLQGDTNEDSDDDDTESIHDHSDTGNLESDSGEPLGGDDLFGTIDESSTTSIFAKSSDRNSAADDSIERTSLNTRNMKELDRDSDIQEIFGNVSFELKDLLSDSDNISDVEDTKESR